MPALPSAPLAAARALCQAGRTAEAVPIIVQFCREKLGLDCLAAHLTPDGYSLNSLNGILTLGEPYLGQTRLFFKYHQEEDESKGVAEYYNSKLLEEAGLPTDVPLAARHEPGEQILLYKVREDARLADVCRDLEHGRATGFTSEEVVQMQRELDHAVGAKYLQTLHLAPAREPAGEALHQLFYHRLVDGEGTEPGGRWRSFYLGQDFAFPGLERPLPWAELSQLRWRINGRRYRRTLGELFLEAQATLAPNRLPEPCPAVLGHGDAHNANLWIERRAEQSRLVYFDPAFAGAHLPALLAEIKPTFHNIFAHPDWLYHPDDAAPHLHAQAEVREGELVVEHDWQLTPLRRAFLEAKEEEVWRPLLLAVQALAPEIDWERYIRLALFCCPTLVMNLRAGAARHNERTSLVGLSIALMCGSECEGGGDEVSEFLARIA